TPQSQNPGPSTSPSRNPHWRPPTRPSTSSTPSEPVSSDPTGPVAPPSTPAAPGDSGVELEFPTRQSAGVPAGWSPVRTVNGSYTVSTSGAVVEDLRINGDLVINAPNVTVRRVEVVDGR